VEPVEQDGEVQSIEDVAELPRLLLAGGVARAPHDLQEDAAHLLAYRGRAFVERGDGGVRVERAS
jgi:hypothetical protein